MGRVLRSGVRSRETKYWRIRAWWVEGGSQSACAGRYHPSTARWPALPPARQDVTTGRFPTVSVRADMCVSLTARCGYSSFRPPLCLFLLPRLPASPRPYVALAGAPLYGTVMATKLSAIVFYVQREVQYMYSAVSSLPLSFSLFLSVKLTIYGKVTQCNPNTIKRNTASIRLHYLLHLRFFPPSHMGFMLS